MTKKPSSPRGRASRTGRAAAPGAAAPRASSTPVVRVLLAGAALTVGVVGTACTKEEPVMRNPPPPIDQQPATPDGAEGAAADGTAADGTAADGTATDGTAADGTAADGTAADGTATDGTAADAPATDALPSWESVESGHPPGATNPPMPVLAVREDGSACFKAFFDPRAVPMEARQKGGIVLDAGEAPPDGATAVACPPEQVREVLEHHASLEASGG